MKSEQPKHKEKAPIELDREVLLAAIKGISVIPQRNGAAPLFILEAANRNRIGLEDLRISRVGEAQATAIFKSMNSLHAKAGIVFGSRKTSKQDYPPIERAVEIIQEFVNKAVWLKKGLLKNEYDETGVDQIISVIVGSLKSRRCSTISDDYKRFLSERRDDAWKSCSQKFRAEMISALTSAGWYSKHKQICDELVGFVITR